MSLPFLSHSLFLIIAVVLTGFWVNNPVLSVYTLQLIAVFIILYFFNSWLEKRKSRNPLKTKSRNLEVNSLILTMVILLLVTSTGGSGSALFFLIYFLLFGLSLTLEPASVITLSLALIIFFFSYQGHQALDHLIPLFSLFFITPLALFFGRQYLQVLSQKGEIKILKKKEWQAEKNISDEETNALMWLNLNFNYSMIKIIDLMSQVLATAKLSFSEKQNLRESLRSAKKLLQTGKILKEKIDRQTD